MGSLGYGVVIVLSQIRTVLMIGEIRQILILGLDLSLNFLNCLDLPTDHNVLYPFKFNKFLTQK